MVVVDYTRFKRKAKRIEQEIKAKSNATIIELCQLGKNHAKSIAPLFSGALIGAISYKTSNNKTEGEIYIRPNAETSGPGGFKDTLSLAKWMHRTNGRLDKGVGKNEVTGEFFQSDNIPPRPRHIISGSPRFMYKTTDYLNKIKKGVAKGHFDKIKIQ
jgi:hypothetical protein